MAKFGVTDGSDPGRAIEGAGFPLQPPVAADRDVDAFPTYSDNGSTPSILDRPGAMAVDTPNDGWTLRGVADDDGLVDARPEETGLFGRARRFIRGDGAGAYDDGDFDDDGDEPSAPIYEATSAEMPARAQVFDDAEVVDDANDDSDSWTGAVHWGDEAPREDEGPSVPDVVRSTGAVAEWGETDGLPVRAVDLPPVVAAPRIIDSLRRSIATTLALRDERRTLTSQQALQLREEQAAARREAALLAEQQAEEARQQHEAYMGQLAEQDTATKTAVIGTLAASRVHASTIEPAELLGLPTIAQANARVRDLVAQELAETADLSSSTLELNRRFFDPQLLESMQTSALFHQQFAQAELARRQHRQPAMEQLTNPADRIARIQDAQAQVSAIVTEAQERALTSVYINPRPENGQPHREYAFDLATQVAGVPEGRYDTIEGSRNTVVFARMAVNTEGRYEFVPEMDGISPILERCGDPQRGEGVFLRNVIPGGLDGRVSGVFVRRPGDTYEGGITIEARYAGKMPVEPNVVTLDTGAVDATAMRAAYLRPQYDAVFEVEARHAHPDHYNQVQAGIIAREELTGRPPYVDIRMAPLFEAQATMEYALTGFDRYARSVADAHAAGRTSFENSLLAAGYQVGGRLMTPRELGSGSAE